uniref:(northern house mosquito) hypothetical protein n=1 Tax=Culex pipiens TaxID=7175 RepID=A0A8D8A9W3_CULPI
MVLPPSSIRLPALLPRLPFLPPAVYTVTLLSIRMLLSLRMLCCWSFSEMKLTFRSRVSILSSSLQSRSSRSLLFIASISMSGLEQQPSRSFPTSSSSSSSTGCCWWPLVSI